MLGRIDYDNMVASFRPNNYVVPSNGYITVTGSHGSSSTGPNALTINGKTVMKVPMSTQSGDNISISTSPFIPVSQGDIVTTNTSGQAYITIAFFPQKTNS